LRLFDGIGDESRRALAERGEDVLQFPVLQRRTLLACTIVPAVGRAEELAWYAERPVVFEKRKGGQLGTSVPK